MVTHILFYHTEKKAWVVNIAKISHEFQLNEFPFLETAVTYSDCPSVETNTWKWTAYIAMEDERRYEIDSSHTLQVECYQPVEIKEEL